LLYQDLLERKQCLSCELFQVYIYLRGKIFFPEDVYINRLYFFASESSISIAIGFIFTQKKIKIAQFITSQDTTKSAK
jgi:hypothetical protein